MCTNVLAHVLCSHVVVLLVSAQCLDFICCSGLGNSLGSPKARPKLSNEPIQLQSVAFNPRLRNTVAFSDNHGNVKVWKLTWKLSNMKPGEERRLGLLADIANVRDFF